MKPNQAPSRNSIITALHEKTLQHADFLLLLTLAACFRFCSVLFFRPGGYTRDYSDLIYYQGRATWQNFGLLPYRDYWSEYPPLFAWFSTWIDRLTWRIPLWEDERLWYAAFFGIAMVLAETLTLLCLYKLARRLYGDAALRVVWIYTGFFLPVYFLSGWYDAMPVATILIGLTLLVEWPTLLSALIAGSILGLGGLLKLVPLATLAILPLSVPRWLPRLVAAVVAITLVIAGYGWAYLHGPVMTLTSVRSLIERTGWSTLYAWVNGYTRLGKVLGDPFNPAVKMAQYESIYPESLVLAIWLALGALVLILLWRRQRAPHPPRTLIAFSALTYTILLLSYSAWNPQYALYLLPFIALLWPNWRGVGYALALMFLVLLEHPIYHNLIGPDYAPIHRQLIDVDYRQLFLAIISARTVVLLALLLDLLALLFVRLTRVRRITPVMTTVAVVVILLLLPQFGRAYAAGRLATSSLRPLARFVNTLPAELPVVTQQLQLGRALRPFLETPERLQLFGGRPARIDPLPTVAAAGPFLYVYTNADDAELAAQVAADYACDPRPALVDWQLWFCNGATLPTLAQFQKTITLTAAAVPARAADILPVTLFWQADAPIPQDYTVFVHVVDASGTMVGQWDQTPGAGESPTTTWSPGRLIVDDYQIPLRRADAVGPYRVLVGLYDPPTGTRLNVIQSERPVSDARLEIATVEGP